MIISERRVDRCAVRAGQPVRTDESHSGPSEASTNRSDIRQQASRKPDLEKTMKVSASVKKICRNCKIIRRHGVVRVICTDPRHKQRQG